MKLYLCLIMTALNSVVIGQIEKEKMISQSNDKTTVQYNNKNTQPRKEVLGYEDNGDSIKAKLVLLALKNAAITEANANIKIAQISRRKAGSSVLNTVVISANVNEFVITNSEQANFWPLYNIGLILPLGTFSTIKAAKGTADQDIIIAKSSKQRLEYNLTAKVLILYESYKEKRELASLQKIILEDDEALYEKAQQDYKNGAIPLENLNLTYKIIIREKSALITKEKELQIARIELEEIIGVPLETVIKL